MINNIKRLFTSPTLRRARERTVGSLLLLTIHRQPYICRTKLATYTFYRNRYDMNLEKIPRTLGACGCEILIQHTEGVSS